MEEILRLVRKVVFSPWTYLYWAVSAAGLVCGHLNTGFNGSPLLGAVSIAATLVMLALFYFHLNKLRNELQFPGPRSTLGLFLSVYAFRLRLLLIFSPVFGFIFWEGTFGRLATEYLVVTTSAPEHRFGELLNMLSHFWLLVATLAAFGLFDIAGRSRVVAQGSAKAILRDFPEIFKKAAFPLIAFALAQFALAFAGEYFSFLEYIKLSERITLALVCALALEPVSYTLQMVAITYLAGRLKNLAPNS